MKRFDQWRAGGKGVMATADAGGAVNTAVYAPPRMIDDTTAAWGMTERRTYANVTANPKASYLYFSPGEEFHGVRLTLRLKEMADSGEILEEIRARTRETAGPGAADALKYVAYFTILEERPLV
jgi:hypothetical protein